MIDDKKIEAAKEEIYEDKNTSFICNSTISSSLDNLVPVQEWSDFYIAEKLKENFNLLKK